MVAVLSTLLPPIPAATLVVMTMEPLWFAFNVPRFQVAIWPDTLDGDGLADTYDRPAGSVSRITTPAAATSRCSRRPACTGAGSSRRCSLARFW